MKNMRDYLMMKKIRDTMMSLLEGLGKFCMRMGGFQGKLDISTTKYVAIVVTIKTNQPT